MCGSRACTFAVGKRPDVPYSYGTFPEQPGEHSRTSGKVSPRAPACHFRSVIGRTQVFYVSATFHRAAKSSHRSNGSAMHDVVFQRGGIRSIRQ